MTSVNSPVSANTFTVLVVEDEPALRLIVTEVLEDDGRFRVIAAGSGDEAMKLLSDYADIDAVFTDVRMPGRTDGIALADYLEQYRPTVKVMIASGHAFALQAVANVPFLMKPYDLQALPDRLNALISGN